MAAPCAATSKPAVFAQQTGRPRRRIERLPRKAGCEIAEAPFAQAARIAPLGNSASKPAAFAQQTGRPRRRIERLPRKAGCEIAEAPFAQAARIAPLGNSASKPAAFAQQTGRPRRRIERLPRKAGREIAEALTARQSTGGGRRFNRRRGAREDLPTAAQKNRRRSNKMPF